jgi:acetyl esterase
VEVAVTLKPEIVKFLADSAAKGLPAPWQGTPSEARFNVKDRPLLTGTPEKIYSVEHRFIPGATADLPIRVYRPMKNTPLPALVYFHGGGWVLNTLDMCEQPLRSLANKGQFVVIAVAYQKAPEHPFPLPFDDCYETLMWVKTNATSLGIDPDAIGVGGESSGANLAAGVAIKARDTGDIDLKFQALIYPAVDETCSSDSYKSFADGYGLTRKSMQWFWAQYLQKSSDRKNPYAVPSLAKSLSGVAPAIVITAEYDVLLDDGYAYAEKLRKDGVKTLYREYEGQIHGCFSLAAITPDSEKIQQYLADEINTLLAPSS